MSDSARKWHMDRSSQKRWQQTAHLEYRYLPSNFEYSSSLKHLLRQKQSFLKHKMSFLLVIVCFPGRRAHEKPFLKALLMSQGVTNER